MSAAMPAETSALGPSAMSTADSNLQSRAGLDADISFLTGFYDMIPGINNIHYNGGLQPYQYPGWLEPIEQRPDSQLLEFPEQTGFMPTPPIPLPVHTASSDNQALFDLHAQERTRAVSERPQYTSTLKVPTSMPAPLDPGQTHATSTPKDNFRLTKEHYQATCEGHWMPYSDLPASSSRSGEGYINSAKYST